MKKLVLALSTLFVGAVADDDKKLDSSGGGNGEVSHLQGGGNGEVKATIIEYINSVYKNIEFYALTIDKFLVAVSDRSGGYTITRTLKKEDIEKNRYLIIILTKNPADTLVSNIKDTKIESKLGQSIIHIPVENIQDRVLISNKKGQKLIEYNIK